MYYELKGRELTPRTSRPKAIGSTWLSESGSYLHGPRIRFPKDFSKMYNLKPEVAKKRHLDLKGKPPDIKFVKAGTLKKTGKLAVQSYVRPIPNWVKVKRSKLMRSKNGKLFRRGKHLRRNYGMVWAQKTTIPMIDYPESYGKKVTKKEMSPEEFMEITRQEAIARTPDKEKKEYAYLFDPKKYESVVIHRPNLERIKEGLRSKEEVVPPAYIELSKEGRIIGHEGRHRAVAAKELGMEKIPVFILEDKQ